MRRNIIWLVSTLAGLGLLLAYRPTRPNADSVTTPTVVATATPSARPSARSSALTNAANGTYDGKLVQTIQGPVQVRIVVSSGQIVDVTAIVYPNDSDRHQQVSSYCLPQLRAAALSAQSADIDTVSGATATSKGYIDSLQAAIDAAHA